jgi:hypothetical protein
MSLEDKMGEVFLPTERVFFEKPEISVEIDMPLRLFIHHYSDPLEKNGGYLVEVTMPWGRRYELYKGRDEEEARKRFSEYERMLASGKAIVRIISMGEARIEEKGE